MRLTFLDSHPIKAPEKDARNVKVVACQNHCSEFQITKFFQVIAVDKEMESTNVTTSVYDGYKFNLEGNTARFIKFQVRSIPK